MKILGVSRGNYVALLAGQADVALLLASGAVAIMLLAKRFRNFLGLLLCCSIAYTAIGAFILLIRGNGGLGGL